MRDLLVAVSQVEVDLVLGAASRFSFTVTDCYSHKLHAFKTGRGDDVLDLLTFGAEVEICLGYGDANRRRPLVSGMITEITDELSRRRAPRARRRRVRPRIPAHRRQELADLVEGARQRRGARDRELQQPQRATIETTKEQHAQIEQNQESDWEFLKKLADRNHFELYVDERKTLHFGHAERQGDRGGSAGLRRRAAELQAGGEPCRPDLTGRGVRLGSEDARSRSSASRLRRRGIGTQRQECGPAPERVRARPKQRPDAPLAPAGVHPGRSRPAREGGAQRTREAVPDGRGRDDRPARSCGPTATSSSTTSACRSRRRTTFSRRRTRSTRAAIAHASK